MSWIARAGGGVAERDDGAAEEGEMIRKRTIGYRYDDSDRRNLRSAELRLRTDGSWSVICSTPRVYHYRTDIFESLQDAQSSAKHWVRGGRALLAWDKARKEATGG